MSTTCDQCGAANPVDIHTCGATKSDPYASEAETRALLVPDTRTEAEKHLDQLIQAESVAEMCGADYSQALRKAALKLVEAVIFVEPCCGEYKTCVKAFVTRGVFLGQQKAAAQPAPVQDPVAWLVCSVNSDGSLSLEHAAQWKEMAHEHISDAILDHGIECAKEWVVRPAYTTPPAAQPAPASWMEMVTANLVREGVNKHKARELAEHFYSLAPAAQPAPCTWTKSNDPHMPDTFDATCGVVWTFTDGGPAENDVRFCPGCGAAVNVDAPEPEEDLYDLAVKADNWGQP